MKSLKEISTRLEIAKKNINNKKKDNKGSNVTYLGKAFKISSELIAAVIRPGVGTVTNSLLSGVKIFSFYENSMEMKRNAEQLDCYGVGVNAKSIRCAWNKAVSYVKDDKNKSKYVKDRSLIDFDGAIEAADIVLGNN